MCGIVTFKNADFYVCAVLSLWEVSTFVGVSGLFHLNQSDLPNLFSALVSHPSNANKMVLHNGA